MELIHSKSAFLFTKPEIITLGNQCFRKLGSQVSVDAKGPSKLAPYNDNDDELINCGDLDDDIEIKVTKSGKFMTQFHVAAAFFGSIIGTRGCKRKELEMDTGTSIKIPKQGETGDVIITGSSERDIASARNRIHMILLKMRDSHQITHFASIPVASNEIRNNFEKFKSNLLNGPPLRGVDETIFQNPNKLHLTIATLVLLDDVEKDLAMQTLHETKEELLRLFKNAHGLKVVLEGLEIMNDDPADVHVLYSKVKLNVPKYNGSFQKMADSIVAQFSKKGLIRNQYENVKLHVTVMNSSYRRGEHERRESFDCTHILKNHRNFYFGEAVFSDVHLSVRFSTGSDCYYEPLMVMQIL